jgi:hypothetical protein
MKRAVILISLLLLLTSFILRTQTTQTIPETKVPQTIALIHDGHLYFIRVKLNNKTANLLIDTGAAASLLDINQAEHYDFTYQESPHRFSGIGGLSEGYRVRNYKIAYDSTMLPLYPFGADLKHVVESFNQKGMSIVGVIGSDFLRSNDAIIDYKRKTLILNKP